MSMEKEQSGEREHVLKTLPVYFDAIKRGDKTFEVRRDDRGFQKGDVLVLQRLRENGSTHLVDIDYNGRVSHEIRCRILWVLTGGQFGIEPGYVVMSLAPPSPSTDSNEDGR